MNCPKCSYENRSGARFCANCGSSLASLAAPVITDTPPQQDVSADNAAFSAPTDAVTVTDTVDDINGAAGSAQPYFVVDSAAEVIDEQPWQESELIGESAATGAEQGAEQEIVALDSADTAGQASVVEPAMPDWPASDIANQLPYGSLPEPPVDAPIDAQPLGADLTGEDMNTLLISLPFEGEGDGDEAQAAQASAPTESALADLPLLELGTLVADRFLVLAVAEDPYGREYEVQDRGVCVSCGAPVILSAEEPYCSECGAYLLDENTPFLTRRLRQLHESAADSSAFVWQEMFFALLEASPSAETPASALDNMPAAPFVHGVNLLVAQRSDRGIARADTPDEDSIFALTMTSVYESEARPTVGLYLVADGMGGHGDGEIASRIAAETVSAALLQTIVIPVIQGQVIGQETIGALLDAAVAAANRRVYENARACGNDMGTTLTLALVIDDQAYIANVGDSRTYLWRQGDLQQITEDHSAVYQLVRKGILQPDEIYTHPQRNQITRNLGFRSDVQVDYFHQELAPHDALLLCCDGLWEMLRNEGIADVLLSNFGDVQTVCDALVKRANLAGGEDNISVVLVRVEL